MLSFWETPIATPMATIFDLRVMNEAFAFVAQRRLLSRRNEFERLDDRLHFIGRIQQFCTDVFHIN